MNRRIFALLAAALLVLSVSGCTEKAAVQAQTDLLATTQPVYQLANALTDGTGLTVSLLISEPVSCLHDYTLTVSQMERIENAKLVLESGLGLEDFMADALSGKVRIVVSSTLPTLEGDEGIDPHWWLDPTRFRAAAKLTAQELGSQYPEFTDQIAENFAALEVESGSEPSAKELEAIVSIVNDQKIPAVFTETNGETGPAQVVANETGCKVYTLDMAISNADYFAAMRENINTIKEALG